jgi:MFS family permease
VPSTGRAACSTCIFVTAVSQRTIVPLLPVVEHRYGLHPAAVAGVLVLPSLAMLVTATPIGILGDRIGNRRVTLAAGALLGLAGLGQAIPSLLALVLARLAFGIGYGAMWTAGLAWLAGLRSGTASRRLGATILASGVGSAVGPTVAGTLASHFGFATPFLVVGVTSSAVAATLGLLARRSGPPSSGEEAVRGWLRSWGSPCSLPPSGRPWPGWPPPSSAAPCRAPPSTPSATPSPPTAAIPGGRGRRR